MSWQPCCFGQTSVRVNRKPLCRLLMVVALFLSCDKEQEPDLGDSFDSYLQEQHFNGNVLIARSGEVLFERSYGEAKVGVEPNTAQTRFMIGSVSKPFTTMAIMILLERGLLDVDDAFSDHLSGLPAAWQEITIHQAMTHTSGLMHSWALPAWRDAISEARSLEENMALFVDEPLLFEPGEAYSYSGVGYFLLARLIEELSDRTYKQFLQEEIFQPLGMNGSGAANASAGGANSALGYADVSRGIPAEDVHMPNLTGGGSLYSTTGDLLKWDEALRSNTLISAASKQLLFTVEQQSYAYGWIIGGIGTDYHVYHLGSLPGFRALIDRYPADELLIVMLTNQEELGWNELVEGFAELVRSKL